MLAAGHRHQLPVGFAVSGHDKSTSCRRPDGSAVDPGDYAAGCLAQSDAGCEMHAPGQITTAVLLVRLRS